MEEVKAPFLVNENLFDASLPAQHHYLILVKILSSFFVTINILIKVYFISFGYV